MYLFCRTGTSSVLNRPEDSIANSFVKLETDASSREHNAAWYREKSPQIKVNAASSEMRDDS